MNLINSAKKNPIWAAVIVVALLYVFMNRANIMARFSGSASGGGSGSGGSGSGGGGGGSVNVGSGGTPVKTAQDSVLADPLNAAKHRELKAVWSAYKYNVPLKKGMKGYEVKVFQTVLNTKGAALNVDGDFGTNTQNAKNTYFPLLGDMTIEQAVGLTDNNPFG